jgi:chromosome segregation ATPase
LGALDTLLSTAPDTDAISAWRSAKAELLSLMSGSGASARRLLSELQASLARTEASASDAALPLGDLRVRLEQLEARKGALAERVARMATERDAGAAAMQRLLQATLELREEQKRLETMQISASPHLQ